MMPGTAHRVADNEPLRERPAVMRTVRPDGEEFRARPRQYHVLVTDVPEDHAPSVSAEAATPFDKSRVAGSFASLMAASAPWDCETSTAPTCSRSAVELVPSCSRHTHQPGVAPPAGCVDRSTSAVS